MQRKNVLQESNLRSVTLRATCLLLVLCSLHEEATELLKRQPFCGRQPGGAGLHPGFPESRAAAAEEASSGPGPRGEGGSEESLPTEALPVPQNHRRAGLPAQPEDQHRHQLVPQLQVSTRSRSQKYVNFNVNIHISIPGFSKLLTPVFFFFFAVKLLCKFLCDLSSSAAYMCINPRIIANIVNAVYDGVSLVVGKIQ